MKFKIIFLILLGCLSLQSYAPDVSVKKVSFSEPSYEAAHSESSQEIAQHTIAQEQAAQHNDTETTNSNPSQSILKNSTSKNSIADSTESGINIDHLTDYDKEITGSLDFGEAVNNQTLQATDKNTYKNSARSVDVSSSIEFNRQAKAQRIKLQKDQADQLARDLQVKARDAKNDDDIQKIISEIDPEGKLTPEIIDQALQASKIWRSPFDGTSFQRWVDVLNRIVSYMTKGQPVSAEFVQLLKNLVTEHNKTVQLNKEKQAKIKEIDDKIAVKDDAIDSQMKKISHIETEMQNNKTDIETHVKTVYLLETRLLGDSQAVKDLDGKIAILEESLLGEKEKLSKLVREMSDLVNEKKLIHDVELPSLQQEVESSLQPNKISNEKNKEESLCDSVQLCVEKIKDPNDTNSLSSILRQVGKLAQDPVVMSEFSKEQQDAINFFVKNGDKIINKFSSLTWTETYNLMKYKDLLPTTKGSQPLNASVLVTKSGQESARVKAEQEAALQQKSATPGYTGLFAVTSV